MLELERFGALTGSMGAQAKSLYVELNLLVERDPEGIRRRIEEGE